MTIRILDLARDDLINGFHFYENKALVWETISLKTYTVILNRLNKPVELISQSIKTSIGHSPDAFHGQSTILLIIE